MEEIQKRLSWVALLLPGFVSVVIVGSIVEFGAMTEFEVIAYSLAAAFVNSSLAYLFLALLARLCCKSVFESLAAFIVAVFIIAILSGIGFGVAAERDYLFRAVRALPFVGVLNKRSAKRPLVFLLQQNTGGLLELEGDARPQEQKVGEAWLRVILKGGDSFEGWPEYYGVGEGLSEIYLSPACTISGREVSRIAGPGVVIPEDQISYAIFLERGASPCFERWLGPPGSGKLGGTQSSWDERSRVLRNRAQGMRW